MQQQQQQQQQEQQQQQQQGSSNRQLWQLSGAARDVFQDFPSLLLKSVSDDVSIHLTNDRALQCLLFSACLSAGPNQCYSVSGETEANHSMLMLPFHLVALHPQVAAQHSVPPSPACQLGRLSARVSPQPSTPSLQQLAADSSMRCCDAPAQRMPQATDLATQQQQQQHGADSQHFTPQEAPISSCVIQPPGCPSQQRHQPLDISFQVGAAPCGDGQQRVERLEAELQETKKVRVDCWGEGRSPECVCVCARARASVRTCVLDTLHVHASQHTCGWIANRKHVITLHAGHLPYAWMLQCEAPFFPQHSYRTSSSASPLVVPLPGPREGGGGSGETQGSDLEHAEEGGCCPKHRQGTRH